MHIHNEVFIKVFMGSFELEPKHPLGHKMNKLKLETQL